MILLVSKKEREKVQKLMKKAAVIAGSQYRLAKDLRISESAVSKLVNGKFLPSVRVCVLIESKYGIKKEDLRPDIFLLN
jgi:DNA-binding transcriptional regulator YdaS (Cro superfamily)